MLWFADPEGSPRFVLVITWTSWVSWDPVDLLGGLAAHLCQETRVESGPPIRKIPGDPERVLFLKCLLHAWVASP